jgi:molybdenum cofactor cytidylyltransferase
MSAISAIVLAAGQSARMPGHNKLLLPLAGKTIIAHSVDNLRASRVSELIVVLGFEADKIQTALAGRNIRFITNPNYARGLSTSIIAGIKAVSENTQAILISLGDLPLIKTSEINRLVSAFESTPPATIAVPVFQGRRGNPVIFDVCYKPEILALRGDAGGKSILARYPQHVLEVEMENDYVLRDIDTPEAYYAIKESS